MSLSLALVAGLAAAPPGLSPYQHESLVAACNAGAKHGLCEQTMAVVMAESSGCVEMVGDDGTSFGCGQLQVWTAREIKPGVTAKQLTRNRALNLSLTAANLARCRDRFRGEGRMFVCYNRPKDALTMTDAQLARHPYWLRIRERLAFVRARYGAE